MPPRRVGYLAILAVALATLVQGRQRVSGNVPTWDTLAFDLVGVAIFFTLARVATMSQDSAPSGPSIFERAGTLVRTAFEAHPGRVGLLLLSLMSLVSAVNARPAAPGSPDIWFPFLYWVGGVLLFLLACVPARVPVVSGAGLALWWKLRRLDLLAVLALAAFAFAVRAAFRETIPYPLTGDEAEIALNALAVVQGRITNLFTTGWLSHPNLSMLLPGALMGLLGDDIGPLRLFPALTGTLGVVALYMLSLEMWGRRVALVAAAYLAAYHFHIQFSRIAVINIVDPTLTTIAFYFLWRGMRTNVAFNFAAAGIACGLSMYSYPGGRILFLLMAAFLGYLALTESGFLRRHALRVAALAGGALVTSLPMALFFVAHPNDFMARVNTVGIFQTPWMETVLRQPGKSLLSVLADQLFLNFFGFIHVPAKHGFYNSPEPLLGLFASVFFMIGLAWSLYRWRSAPHFLIALWLLAMVAGTALTTDPPNAARMVVASPAVALLVTVGLLQVVDLVRSFSAVSFRTVQVMTFVAALLLCAGSLRFYFIEYTPGRYFADPNGELGMEAGYFLRNLGPQYHVYFYGTPRMFYGFASIPFLSRGIPGMDVLPNTPPDLSFVKRDRGAVFLFIPERRREAEQLATRFPEGQLVATQRRYFNNETLFVALVVPPPAPAGTGAPPPPAGGPPSR